MTVKYEENGKCVTFFFDGRMDTIKCMTAEKEIVIMLDDYEEIIFDLQNVEYIASSFLRLCGRASNKVKPGRFSIINVTPSVKKVFKIAGLADRLNLK